MGEKAYDELGFTDDYLFCRILTENEDLCVELAEMITGRKIRSLVRREEQKAIRLTEDGKGVRFDVYFEDEDNVVYDIEMQTTKKKNLSKRTRYYQGMLDLNILSKGDGYGKLKESYIIFICTFDAFGKGRHKYTFTNLCVEDTSISLEDGSHKIFLCAEGNVDDCSEKMQEFLDYITKKEVKGDFSRRLEQEVTDSRRKERWRFDYMTLFEKYEEKKEEGREEHLIRQICRKLRKGKDAAQIADDLEEDEIRMGVICGIAKEFAPDYDEEQVIAAVRENVL